MSRETARQGEEILRRQSPDVLFGFTMNQPRVYHEPTRG